MQRFLRLVTSDVKRETLAFCFQSGSTELAEVLLHEARIRKAYVVAAEMDGAHRWLSAAPKSAKAALPSWFGSSSASEVGRTKPPVRA